MSAKPTPGPWKQDKYLNIVDGKGERVLFRGVSSLMSGEKSDIEESEANTKLAAAAHDLLEALKWYVENDDTNIGMEGNEFWEEGLEFGKAALAKATGA